MKRFIAIFVGLSMLTLISFLTTAFGQGQSQELANSPKIIARSRDNNGEQPFGPAKTGNARPGSNGISYHGGPLLGVLGGTPVSAYYIWYGNWSGNNATTILTDLIQNIAPSPYYNINTTYYNASNAHVVNSVTYGGSTTVGYTHGTTLSDSGVQAVVSDAITSGALPNNSAGIYFVLTSADVNESSGFCTSYCGWHTYGTIAGSNIKYAFIGNAARCPSACAAQTNGPNGNAGADGMASIIAHELEETVTDPNINGWYQGRYQENGDLCAWHFGTTYTVANGAQANMRLGSRDFLIQQNWVNALGGYCALSY